MVVLLMEEKFELVKWTEREGLGKLQQKNLNDFVLNLVNYKIFIKLI